MKSALSRYNGFLAIVLPVFGLLYVVPVASACDCSTSVVGGCVTGVVEECNNGRGRSIPGLPNPMPYCTKVDCCNWYQTAHIHDVSHLYNYFLTHPTITIHYHYTPGYSQYCRDTLTLSTSTDGTNFSPKKHLEVTSVWGSEGWKEYKDEVTVNGAFKYIKIEIPKCYNDHSWISQIDWK